MATTKSGFSLVELSIVLVILGLLTGGVLGGRQLIRSARLLSISTEYQQWRTAIDVFHQRYNAVPGDMYNATDHWGDAGVCASVTAETHSVSLNGTCNGSGNGIAFTNYYDRYEQFLFWQHLTLAGLIAGQYSGIPAPGGPNTTLPGVNTPKANFPLSEWRLTYSRTHADPNNHFILDYSNALTFEAMRGQSSGLLTPAEARSIDRKHDDGKPASGLIIARNHPNCTNTTDKTDYHADYLLAESRTTCGLFFRPKL